jgi:protein involved in polysaccharide export with SLBB domain
MISLPLIGEVRAAGLTPEQLRQRLTALFAPYIRNPQVAVIVREFRRVRVTVLGQVVRPGVYELRQGATVLDALAAAGGLTEAAGLGEVKLVRGQTQPITIDLERLLLRGEVALNQRLEPGDTLVVPEDFTSRVYVLGEVTKPGVFPLRGPLTVLQALSLAGGPTRRALLNRSYVIRRAGEAPQAQATTIQLATVVVARQESPAVRIIPVDLLKIIREGDVTRDIPLQRGDILYVPENPMAVENILIILGGLSTLRDILR